MESGTLVEWLKKPGEAVQAGDIVAVVETQKGAIEIEVFESGVFERSLVDLGRTVPVGTAIAIISGFKEAPAPKPAQAAPAAPAVAAQRMAPPRPELGFAASPAARKLAEEKGVDLSQIKGSGPDGAIIYVDVENAIRQGIAPPIVKPAAEEKPRPGIDLKAMRSIIAAATARAKREIPHYYLAHSVDLSEVVAWLAATNASRPPETRLLIGAVFLRSLALALRSFPAFNGFYRDDAFMASERIHIGVAIALRGSGLVAPAIHDVDRLSLDEVMARLRDIVGRVRAGRFRSSELSDPTITLTSLGDRGVDMVIPIIYPPQVAIAGTGTMRERPWVVDGKVVPRQTVDLSLAADHRVSDGHSGALFLAEWAKHLGKADKL
jgi:pyruvate dehydrogenase E2 component (dihydrolipoamide acetyltransferase)